MRQADIRTGTVAIRIGAQRHINSFGCVLQIEVKCTTESTSPNRAVPALEFTATIQIKLVNNHTALHISHADVECEDGLANSKRPQEEACGWTAPVHYIEFAINEPAGWRSLVRPENPGWGNFFELLP